MADEIVKVPTTQLAIRQEKLALRALSEIVADEWVVIGAVPRGFGESVSPLGIVAVCVEWGSQYLPSEEEVPKKPTDTIITYRDDRLIPQLSRQAYYDQIILFFDVGNQQELCRLSAHPFLYNSRGELVRTEHPLGNYCWSADGRYLVTGSNNHENALRLFDCEGREFCFCFGHHGDSLRKPIWSSNGKFIATCSPYREGHLRLWNVSWNNDLFGESISNIDLVGVWGNRLLGFSDREKIVDHMAGVSPISFDNSGQYLAAILRMEKTSVNDVPLTDFFVVWRLPFEEVVRIPFMVRCVPQDMFWQRDGNSVWILCDDGVREIQLHDDFQSDVIEHVGMQGYRAEAHPTREIVAIISCDEGQESKDFNKRTGALTIYDLSEGFPTILARKSLEYFYLDDLRWSADGQLLYVISKDILYTWRLPLGTLINVSVR